MEYFDIVDENGQPTGETVSRSEAHATGTRHRTSHVWIIRRNDDGTVSVLLQKRSLNKDSYPGKYDTSSAGHIPAGDAPVESALRELAEELGIRATADQLKYIGHCDIRYSNEFHGKRFSDNEYCNIFLYEEPVELDDLVLQEEELAGADWFDFEELVNTLVFDRAHFCVPHEGLAVLKEYLSGNA